MDLTLLSLLMQHKTTVHIKAPTGSSDVRKPEPGVVGTPIIPAHEEAAAGKFVLSPGNLVT